MSVFPSTTIGSQALACVKVEAKVTLPSAFLSKINIPVEDPMNSLSLYGKMVSIPQPKLLSDFNAGFSGVWMSKPSKLELPTTLQIIIPQQ